MDKQPDDNNPTRFELIIGLLDDAVVVLDSDFKVTYLNPSAEALLQTSGRIIGQSLQAIMQNNFQVTLSFDTPIALTVDNATRYYQLQQKPIPQHIESLIVFHDVTEQHHAQIELKRLQDNYSNFAHTVAHDVKSPLGVAIGYSNMLQADLDANTEARVFADEIFDTSMRIMYICSELTVLSELGHTELVDVSSVNLQTAIDNGLRRLEKEITAQNIHIDVPDDIPFARGNAMWIDEIMINFLYLAIHRNPTHITLTAKANENDLCLQIHHDGTPLSADEQATLFDSDRLLDQIRAQGQGLGIDIAARLVKRLGGRVGVDDGLTLCFSLLLDA